MILISLRTHRTFPIKQGETKVKGDRPEKSMAFISGRRRQPKVNGRPIVVREGGAGKIPRHDNGGQRSYATHRTHHTNAGGFTQRGGGRNFTNN